MKILTANILALGIVLNIVSAVHSEDIIYRKDIKPLFDMKCAMCHGTNAAPEYQAFKEEKGVHTLFVLHHPEG